MKKNVLIKEDYLLEVLPQKGYCYIFDEITLEEMIVEFVRNKTGFTLDLRLGCYADCSYDVFLSWKADEKTVDDFNEYESKQDDTYIPLNLHPQEVFMNRDHVLQLMFNDRYASCEYNGNRTYHVFVSSRQDHI